MSAAVEGAHGEAVAMDAKYNGLVNDKGCRNTNKAGDLKVEATNKKWQDRSRDLKGNFTEQALERISKWVMKVIFSIFLVTVKNMNIAPIIVYG